MDRTLTVVATSHEAMCDVSPLSDTYNPFLLCGACSDAILEADAITWYEEQAARLAATERRLGIASWLTRMNRRFPIRVAFGGR